MQGKQTYPEYVSLLVKTKHYLCITGEIQHYQAATRELVDHAGEGCHSGDSVVTTAFSSGHLQVSFGDWGPCG